MDEAPLRILALCLALAGAETLHGIARTSLLAPRIGRARAIKVAIVTGSVLAFGVCFLLVPGIGLTRTVDLLGLGLLLATFMAGFDVTLARLVLRLPWSRVLGDFDPRTGNYLLFGLIGLVLWPLLVMRLL